MSSLEEAQADFAKKDKRLRTGAVVLITYVVLLLTFVAVQTLVTQNTIADNQKVNAKASEDRFARYVAQNERQHKITQAYVKCIANALLVPVDKREPSAFDDCGIEARKDVEKNSGGSEGTSFLAPQNSSTLQPSHQQTPATITSPQPAHPAPQPPVATAPPDPDSPLLVLTAPLLPLDLSVDGILKVGN